MKYTDNALNLMSAMSFKGIGRAKFTEEMVAPNGIGRLLEMLAEKAGVSQEAFESARRKIADELSALPDTIRVTAWGDADFPVLSAAAKGSDRPMVLFYCGDIGLLSDPMRNVAVIGQLNPDVDTVADERKVVRTLAEKGKCIVSGLALGCDSVAHETALDCGAKTVAVMPCELTTVIPAENRELAKRILQTGGLLVSEYWRPARSRYEMAARFVERDRLQALFSSAVVLAGSHDTGAVGQDTGSRHALETARKYKITRAAIFDSIRHQNRADYAMNRHIIQEGGIAIDPDNPKTALSNLHWTPNLL